MKVYEQNEELIEEMAENRYFFDRINSTNYNLIFYTSFGGRLSFTDWNEVADWLDGVII